MQEISFNLYNFLEQNNLSNQINIFSDLLLRWNKIHNLTGIKDKHSLELQLQDSLLPTTFLQSFCTCIDVGSGAGFPALILACYYQQAEFYLLEPRLKRASFLENAVCAMGLKNVKVITDFSYNINHIQGDLITSRAVCESALLIKQSKHLLYPFGYYLLFKGQKSAKEYLQLQDFKTNLFYHQQRIFFYAKSLS